MDIEEFDKWVRKAAAEAKKAPQLLARKIESIALRFVDDNFQKQGWEGTPWRESEGTILVKSGALRRGFEATSDHGEVKVTNAIPYAVRHNEGFDGTVSVKGHDRATLKGKGSRKVITGTHKVKAHSKKVKTHQRQFAPTESNPSPSLNTSVSTAIKSHVNDLLTP